MAAARTDPLILSLSKDAPCAIGRDALLWLRVRELEGHETPTLRAASQVVAPAAAEPEVHRAVIALRWTGHVLFTHLHTGRVIYVELTGNGRALADRLIADSGRRIEPLRTRKCLSCSRRFVSDWSGHRICDHCKATETWRNADLAPLHL